MTADDQDYPPLWNTRLAVGVAAAVAFLATLIVYAPGNWAFACVVLLTDGVRAAAWVFGAAALGAVLLRATGVRSNPLLQVASAGGVGLGVFGLGGLALGLCGMLNRGVAIAMPLGGGVLFAADHVRRYGLPDRQRWQSASRAWLLRPAGLSWLWLVPVVSLATASLAACVMPGDLWKPLDPHPYDVVSYHLQVPREWYEAGRIVPLEHNVFSYFPFNVEMQFLLLMHASGGAEGPWAGMYACQLLNVGYAVLMVCAIAGSASGPLADSSGERSSAREITLTPTLLTAGVSRRERGPEAAVAAAVVSCVPWVIMLASVAYVESALMLYTALALIWAMRSLSSAWPTRGAEPAGSIGSAGAVPFAPVVLAGVFAGLAAGVKITAVPMLVAAVPVGLLAVDRRAWTAATVFLLAAGLVLAPWLIRTAVWSGGNPLFPVAMHTLGHGHFSPEQVTRFVAAHSPTPAERPWGARLRITWTDVLAQWQFGYVLLPAGLLAAAVRWRDPKVRFLLAAGGVTFLVWIGFTHLLGRFLIQWVPLAAILLASVRWNRAWPAGVVLVLLAAGLGWSGVYPRLTFTTHNPEHPERAILIGVQNLSFMVPDELNQIQNADKCMALVGDAGAFLYQIPMTRLRYRTVFDVPAGVADPVRAWAGADVIGDPDWLLVINPSEVTRLHGTYAGIPALPRAWGDRVEPFVLDGAKVR